MSAAPLLSVVPPAPVLDVPREQVRLLVVAPGEKPKVEPFGRFAQALKRGDVMVLNDAATFPASVKATTARGETIELRLFDPDGLRWEAVAFGAGDFRQKTEDRPAPPPLPVGSWLNVGPLKAKVVAVSTVSARWVTLLFDATEAELWHHLYAHGAPVQYAYRADPEPLWAFQNAYAAHPWAAENPSAGRPLTVDQLLAARREGVEVLTLTHATGLSSTGEVALDAALPLPERYRIPAETAVAVTRARNEGRRVVAVGTSVMRALEGTFDGRRVPGGEGWTSLVIDQRHRLKVVSGLLTGIHVPGESHYRLLKSLVPDARLKEATQVARDAGLVEHERGDAALIWKDR